MESVMWSPGMSMKDVERAVFSEAFGFYQGNKTAIAKALDVSIRTVDAKIDKFKLGRPKVDREVVRKKMDLDTPGKQPPESFFKPEVEDDERADSPAS